jgi:ribose transport system permease protein
MVSTVGMPALIATFATQTIFKGLAYIISGGTPINGFTVDFKIIGQGYIGPIPVPVIIMVICFALGSFILNKTYFGRYFYAVGGNEEAAKLSGIRVGRVKYLVYSLSGLFAGLAGIVMLSRTNSAQATAGDGYEFDVITCVVLGGVSVTGGYGKLSNVVAGVLIIGALTNGMVLMNVSSYVQLVVKGLVLAFAVGFDCIQKKRQTT